MAALIIKELMATRRFQTYWEFADCWSLSCNCNFSTWKMGLYIE